MDKITKRPEKAARMKLLADIWIKKDSDRQRDKQHNRWKGEKTHT